MPFQVEAVHKSIQFLKSDLRATYNASQMGLGKSIQTIAALNSIGAPLPLLIICPAVVRLNWEKELLKWKTFNTNIHTILSGKDLNKLNEFQATDTIIISYDLAAKDKTIKLLSQWKWGALVLDESHFLKSRNAKRTKAILGNLWDRAQYRIALSGTPFTQSVGDGYTLFNKIMPDTFTNYYSFVETFAFKQRTPWGDKYFGVKHPEKLSKHIRDNFFIRYRKDEVLLELPDKVFTEITLPATYKVNPNQDEKAAAHEYFKQFYVSLKAGLQPPRPPVSLGSIRRQQSKKKVAPVAEFVQELLDSGEPVVLFGWHTDFINGLKEALSKYNPVVIVGATSARDRDNAVTDFQDGKSDLFIGNMVAAGVGITLTRASVCVLGEVDYSPSTILQSVDRLHRIGQKNTVNVYYFIVKDSLEEAILRTAVEKAQTFERVIDAGRARGSNRS